MDCSDAPAGKGAGFGGAGARLDGGPQRKGLAAPGSSSSGCLRGDVLLAQDVRIDELLAETPRQMTAEDVIMADWLKQFVLLA